MFFRSQVKIENACKQQVIRVLLSWLVEGRKQVQLNLNGCSLAVSLRGVVKMECMIFVRVVRVSQSICQDNVSFMSLWHTDDAVIQCPFFTGELMKRVKVFSSTICTNSFPLTFPSFPWDPNQLRKLPLCLCRCRPRCELWETHESWHCDRGHRCCGTPTSPLWTKSSWPR